MERTMNGRALWKRALPVMAFLGAGLLTACEKPTPETTPVDPVKVLRFGEMNVGYDALQYDTVMKYANNPHITTIIYLLDSTNNNNNYTGYGTQDISYLRNYLQERLDYTSKATGAGTFKFMSGAASVEDSLWFVANGWKIRPWSR